MKYTTTGELIEILQQFPIDTPVLKADPVKPVYYPIVLTGQMKFSIRYGGDQLGDHFYLDAGVYKGFTAVIL